MLKEILKERYRKVNMLFLYVLFTIASCANNCFKNITLSRGNYQADQPIVPRQILFYLYTVDS